MNKYTIKNETEMEAIIGHPRDIIKSKVLTQLDEVMKEFISKSTLIFMSTIDENGYIDVSPKGDPGGFVKISDSGNLLIPDRPGNRLTFGHRNILRNGIIGLIFIVPNQLETLRVKGTAILHNDPSILAKLQVNNKPALLCTSVEVKECFMHCGKALIRSNLWRPQTWDASEVSLGIKQFAATLGGGTDSDAIQKAQELLVKAYRDNLY